MARRSESIGSHFAWFNDLVDLHLHRLNEKELKVLLVFFRHADRQLESFPGPAMIARKVGYATERPVYTVLRSLKRKGFLLDASLGGGRGNVKRRRLLLPTLQPTQTLYPTDSVSETQTLSAQHTNPVSTETQTLSLADRRTDHDQTMEQTKVVQEIGKKDSANEKRGLPPFDRNPVTAIRDELLAMGVSPTVAAKLAMRPRLQPITIRLRRLNVPPNVFSPAGWVVSEIEAGRLDTCPPIDPKLVCDLVRKRQVIAVAGRPVEPGTLRYNRHGLYFGPATEEAAGFTPPDVRADQLSADMLELSPAA